MHVFKKISCFFKEGSNLKFPKKIQNFGVSEVSKGEGGQPRFGQCPLNILSIESKFGTSLKNPTILSLSSISANLTPSLTNLDRYLICLLLENRKIKNFIYLHETLVPTNNPKLSEPCGLPQTATIRHGVVHITKKCLYLCQMRKIMNNIEHEIYFVYIVGILY